MSDDATRAGADPPPPAGRPEPTRPEVSSESLIRVLDGISSTLLDVHGLVTGDPDVRLACAGLAEQVTQQLRPGGWHQALAHRQTVAAVAAGRPAR